MFTENGRQIMEITYFWEHGPASAPLATPMVLWQLHSTALVLDNDYYLLLY